MYWQGKNSVSVKHNIKFSPTTVTVLSLPPIPPIYTPPAAMVMTAQGPAIPITLQQATASLPTPPISIATNVPLPASPMPMQVHSPQPPPATNSGEKELPDEDNQPPTPQLQGYTYPPSTPQRAPIPALTRKSACLAAKQA
jgi:hypothetical protein